MLIIIVRLRIQMVMMSTDKNVPALEISTSPIDPPGISTGHASLRCRSKSIPCLKARDRPMSTILQKQLQVGYEVTLP